MGLRREGVRARWGGSSAQGDAEERRRGTLDGALSHSRVQAVLESPEPM